MGMVFGVGGFVTAAGGCTGMVFGVGGFTGCIGIAFDGGEFTGCIGIVLGGGGFTGCIGIAFDGGGFTTPAGGCIGIVFGMGGFTLPAGGCIGMPFAPNGLATPVGGCTDMGALEGLTAGVVVGGCRGVSVVGAPVAVAALPDGIVCTDFGSCAGAVAWGFAFSITFKLPFSSMTVVWFSPPASVPVIWFFLGSVDVVPADVAGVWFCANILSVGSGA
jgi:hypothetical protein